MKIFKLLIISLFAVACVSVTERQSQEVQNKLESINSTRTLACKKGETLIAACTKIISKSTSDPAYKPDLAELNELKVEAEKENREVLKKVSELDWGEELIEVKNAVLNYHQGFDEFYSNSFPQWVEIIETRIAEGKISGTDHNILLPQLKLIKTLESQLVDSFKKTEKEYKITVVNVGFGI